MLSALYHPITAQPYRQTDEYAEVKACEALRPYVRCFWGALRPYASEPSLEMRDSIVTPDTCMDIIFDIDHGQARTSSVFCGINDRPILMRSVSRQGIYSTFAIRFYAWAVTLFSDGHLRDVLNYSGDPTAYFRCLYSDLEGTLLETPLMRDRVKVVERYLLTRLDLRHQDDDVMNSVHYILKSRGVVRIGDLSGYVRVGKRQLERLFSEHIGVSPKKMVDLVRYQYLWREMLGNSALDVQDAVVKYGYADQSHLLRDFKRFHAMTPTEARRFARSSM